MTENISPKRQVLFLCTGNYYRSRFAEIYFNHKASNTNWISFSRGLALDPRNSREMSIIAVKELYKLNIIIKNPPFPKEVEFEDMEKADMIIGMNESEHKKMIEDRFPQFKDKVSYWDIADIFERESSLEVPKIIQNIDQLIKELVILP